MTGLGVSVCVSVGVRLGVGVFVGVLVSVKVGTGVSVFVVVEVGDGGIGVSVRVGRWVSVGGCNVLVGVIAVWEAHAAKNTEIATTHNEIPMFWLFLFMFFLTIFFEMVR